MENAVLNTDDATLNPDGTTVGSLYAAAAARLVVTSKRRFTTSCGAHRLTGEVMTIGYVHPNEAAALEASIGALIGDDLEVETAGEGSVPQASGAIVDPDVLLAWLLTEGVTERH